MEEEIAEPFLYEAQNAWHALLDPAGTDAVTDVITDAGTPPGAWNALERRYRPQDTAAISQLRHSMRNASLKPNSDPLELLAELLAKFENLRARLASFGEHVGPQSMLLDFLDRLPPHYEQEVRQVHAKETL